MTPVQTLRPVGASICETEADAVRRRRKLFWLWAINSRPIMGAFTALMLVIFLAVNAAFLDGGNGLVFLGWLASLVGLMVGLLQFIWRKEGYTVRDWQL